MENKEKILRAYELQFTHAGKISDNFFKRVHVFMAAGEAALVVLALGALAHALELKACPKQFFTLLGMFSLGGVLLAVTWFVLGTRQLQVLELNRRYLRHLEGEAWRQGIPIASQTLEAFVAYPRSDVDALDRFGVSLADENGIGVVRFRHEEFPDDSGPWRYRRWVAQAGVGPLETALSWGFGVAWFVAAIVSTVGLFANEGGWAATGLILCIVGSLLLLPALLPRCGWKKWVAVALGTSALAVGVVFICVSLQFTW